MSLLSAPDALRHPRSKVAAVQATPLRWWRWATICVAVTLAGAQLAEIPWRHALRGYDNTFNYLWLRSLMVDGDWSFANDVVECPTLTEEDLALTLELQRHRGGKVLNKYGVGWAVLTTPAYLMADAVVAAGTGIGIWSHARDGWNPVYQIAIVLWHVTLAFVALGFARAVLRRWAPEPWASAGLLTVWLGSALPFYQMSNISMSHGAVFLSIAVAAWALIHAREMPDARWPWLLAGAALALAAITRYQTAIYGLLALWALGLHLRDRGWAGIAAAAWMILGALPWITVQLLAWRTTYGSWLVFSYGAEGETFHWLRPALFGVMFSPNHGLFYWHPLLLIAGVGLGWWAVVRRGIAVVWLMLAAIALYVNAAWWCWWFGASFGHRAFDGALLGLMAGQAFLFTRLGERARRWLWIVCAAFALWNIYVLLLYRTAAISRNEPVTWTEMIRAGARLPEQLAFE